ncbi:helix-turn-helix transcriptional regulator [Erysipelotrichaceae bacterium HCN-30851]
MKNKVRELRQEFNMTQEDLARQCSVSRQTIISLERGKYDPSIHLAHRIAVIFKKHIEEIFIFEEGSVE